MPWKERTERNEIQRIDIRMVEVQREMSEMDTVQLHQKLNLGLRRGPTSLLIFLYLSSGGTKTTLPRSFRRRTLLRKTASPRYVCYQTSDDSTGDTLPTSKAIAQK
mmetsp:Transcript_52678/g.94800  ORF Transcript_52678/g.94800 Transcript_52678/m.94800 type:complete len:106 (-) Transcript_52678:2-319(-)